MIARRLVLALVVLAALPARARAQAIPVRPAGDLSSLVGMPFDVPIVADWTGRPDKLGSFAVTLRWDAAVLRFDLGVPGSFGTLNVNSDSVAFGVLKLAGANPAGATGIVTLGVGRFTPLTASTTPVTLELGDIFSAAPDFADLTGSADVQSGLFCPARGHWGDPDQDRSAGSRDALIALSEAVGLDVSAFPEHGLADVDADGSVKARDALIILSYAVGFDVTGNRVLRVAVGSCGSEATTTYAVTPTGQTIVARGETDLHFELRATAAGGVRTLPDVFWRSSDPAVLAILPDGRGVPVGPGSAVVTGKSGQLDSATATVTVVSRRPQHVVDAAAVSAVNRLGTPAYPYASLVEASRVVSEGDTVVVRPGRYGDAAAFGVGVVVLGQSGGQGVVLAGNDESFGAALLFTGGLRAEVHNVSAERVAVGVGAVGVDTLVVDSLRYIEGAGYCGDYAVATGEIWRLEVRRSDLRGGGAQTGCSGAIGVNGAARYVLVEDVRASDFGGGGIFAVNADSLIVRRSQISDNSGYAVEASANRFGGGGTEVPAPTSLALVVEDSKLLRNVFGGGISADQVRDGRVARTLIDMVEGDGIYISGTPDTTDRFSIVADTVRGRANYWASVYDIDTLLVDAVTVHQTQAGYFAGYKSLRVARATFDLIQGTPLYFDGYYESFATVDSVTITGDPACHRCEDGIAFYAAPGTVSHFTGANLANAIRFDYGTGSVDHSTISDAGTGIYGYDNTGAASRLSVRAVTMTDVQSGVAGWYNAVVADSLDLTSGVTGVGAYTSPFFPSGRDSVTRSTIRDFDTAMELNDSNTVAIGNTIERPFSYGVRVAGFDTPADSSIIANNTITCAGGGAAVGTAVYGYGATFAVSGNTIGGCSQGIYLSATTSSTAVLRGNAISMPPQASNPAITVPAPLRAEIVGNTVLGGGYLGGIHVYGFNFFPVPFARVDSNIVRGTAQRAIFFEYTDSLQAWGNVIDTVLIAPGYSSGAMGIVVYGTTNGAALIGRNRIRHVQGHGIWLDVIGAAVINVDSNAVSTSDSSAVRIATGILSMSGNNITNNARYGLWNLAFGPTQEVHGNAFTGNGVYAVKAEDGTIVNVNSNWWGDPAGPNNPGADSVFGSVVDSTPLAAPPGGLLAPSAPVRFLASYVQPLAALAGAVRPAAAPARVEPSPAQRHTPRQALVRTRVVNRPALPPEQRVLRRAP